MIMKRQIIATWNPETEEGTKITFTEGYEKMDTIEKLDFIVDLLSDLQERYNKLLYQP